MDYISRQLLTATISEVDRFLTAATWWFLVRTLNFFLVWITNFSCIKQQEFFRMEKK